MEKCNCYHEEYGRTVCWGTKEKDVCSCNGDETKCNFYPNKRAAALANKAIVDVYKKEAMFLEAQISSLKITIERMGSGTVYFNVFQLDAEDLRALIAVREKRIKDISKIMLRREQK